MPRSSFRLAGRSPPSTGDPSGADLNVALRATRHSRPTIAVEPETGATHRHRPHPRQRRRRASGRASCWPASALAYKSSLTGPTAQGKPWLPWPKPATAGL